VAIFVALQSEKVLSESLRRLQLMELSIETLGVRFHMLFRSFDIIFLLNIHIVDVHQLQSFFIWQNVLLFLIRLLFWALGYGYWKGRQWFVQAQIKTNPATCADPCQVSLNNVEGVISYYCDY